MSEDTVKSEADSGRTYPNQDSSLRHQLFGRTYVFRPAPRVPILPASKPKKSKRAMAMRRRGR